MNGPVAPDPWQHLRRFTPARIALGRAGNSLPTVAVLELGAAHAQARDAVHTALAPERLLEQLRAEGFEAIGLHSAARDREQYLRRPDLGQCLDEASRNALGGLASRVEPGFIVVIADGLSSQAAHRHALPLVKAMRAQLSAPPRRLQAGAARDPLGWGPVVVAGLARVALGDEIGAILRARQVAVLIGERPGLSAPDSLGIYFTHAPRVGCANAGRNCISNVRPQGLSYAIAARRLALLSDGARALGRSGVLLKDESATAFTDDGVNGPEDTRPGLA